MMQMISFNMKKIHVFIIVLGITFLLLTIVFVLGHTTSYTKLSVSEEEWNQLMNGKKEDSSLEITSITMNDIPLIVDSRNHTIYMIQYNIPKEKMKFQTTLNDSSAKIVFNDEIVSEDAFCEVLIYTKDTYAFYQILLKENSMVDISYKGILKNTKDANILFIDNQIQSSQKIKRSDATITRANPNDYVISLRMESIGRNTRENNISLFGMEIGHDFLLHKFLQEDAHEEIKVELFLNHEYQGVYLFEYNDRIGG